MNKQAHAHSIPPPPPPVCAKCQMVDIGAPDHTIIIQRVPERFDP